MKEEKKYSGSKTRNYFTAYLLASIQGRRLRYLEKQQKILFAEENLEDKEITDIDISLEERLELEKKEQLLLDESKGIYPGWNEIMNFKELLYRARQGDEDAILEIFEMYRPLLIKSALVDGIFDEDLYQELTAELLKCIRYFRDVE